VGLRSNCKTGDVLSEPLRTALSARRKVIAISNLILLYFSQIFTTQLWKGAPGRKLANNFLGWEKVSDSNGVGKNPSG
jgi:hypothetical protein